MQRERFVERGEILMQLAERQAVLARERVVRQAVLLRELDAPTCSKSNQYQRGRISSNSRTKYSGTPC